MFYNMFLIVEICAGQKAVCVDTEEFDYAPFVLGIANLDITMGEEGNSEAYPVYVDLRNQFLLCIFTRVFLSLMGKKGYAALFFHEVFREQVKLIHRLSINYTISFINVICNVVYNESH
jgi:hypothetical protein